jgi:hypothetical protein
MNTSDKVLMWISIVLVVIALLLFGVRVVFAESICDNTLAENYGQPGECTFGGMLPGYEDQTIGLCLDPNHFQYAGEDYLEYLDALGIEYYDVCGWDSPPAEPPTPEPSASQTGRMNYRYHPVLKGAL